MEIYFKTLIPAVNVSGRERMRKKVRPSVLKGTERIPMVVRPLGKASGGSHQGAFYT